MKKNFRFHISPIFLWDRVVVIPFILLLVVCSCKLISPDQKEEGSLSDPESSPETGSQGWVTRGGINYGIFAPEDAWLEGDTLPYYGSENEWSRRMFEQGAADRYYKRRGQRQMLAILDGEPERAIEYCNRRLETDPDDPETHYMLSLAYCQLNRMKKAERAMKRALKNGLTFGRYMAGPRELVEPLKETKTFRGNLKTSSPVVHGPMLGNITSKSVSCWVRTYQASEMIMEVWESSRPDFKNFSGMVTSDPEKDFTAVLHLEGLEPQTEYNYNLIVNGKSVWGDQSHRFSTTAPEGMSGTIKVAFGGGAGYTPEAEKIWLSILENEPEALLLLGDNVYVDLPEMPGPFHDYTYYCRQSRPEFRTLISQVPVYAIWDDHDAAYDDVWLGPYLDKPAWKLPMIRHFMNNWNNPAYGTEEWPGCWFNFTMGDVEFFMIDGRTYRTVPFGNDPTMLGPVQKQWLMESLVRSRAKIKVLVSPVPWNEFAKPESHDTWSGFINERNEIFDFIKNERIPGVLLLSADRHRTEVWEVSWNGDYPLYEFSSSRLTNIHFHDIVPGALFSYNELQSFGLLTIKTLHDPPEVIFEIVNLHAEVVYQNTFIVGEQ